MSYNLDTNLKPIKLFLNHKNYTLKVNEYSNYLFELNETITKYSNMDLLVSLESFTFTNSIFNINDSNNNLYYSFGEPSLGPVVNVRITNGNYSIDDLITNLNYRCLDELSFSFNSSTLKITITSLRETGFRIVTDFNNNSNPINSLLGFDDIFSNTLTNSKTGNYIINLNSNVGLNICLNNVNLKSNNVKNDSKKNILAYIPIISSFGEVQTYQNTNNFKYSCDENTISNINLEILNQDNKSISFNNIAWYIVINFEFIYSRELVLPPNYLNEIGYLHNDLRDRFIEIEKNKILSKK